MKKVGIEAKIEIANKYTIIAEDLKTGKVIKGYAYNLVTNKGLERLVSFFKRSNSSSYKFFTNGYSGLGAFGENIHVGSGTTTPAATDTTLATLIGYKTSTRESGSEDTTNLWGKHVRKATWAPADAIGEEFKEVGYGDASTISSRALIVDSEGDPLTITKTSTMQITIYYAFYITLTHSYGSSLKFVGGSASQNYFLTMIRYGGKPALNTYEQHHIRVGSNGATPAFTDEAVKTQLATSDVTPGTSGYKVTFSHRFGTADGNGKIKEIGMAQFVGYEDDGGTTHNITASTWRAIMPLTGIFTGSTFTDADIGTGDGSNKDFTLTETDSESTSWLWNEITSGSLTVKVDGVTQTEGTDYTYTDSTGTISFTTAPANTKPVTATWTVPYIAKSNDYVLDISFSYEFANGSVPS